MVKIGTDGAFDLPLDDAANFAVGRERMGMGVFAFSDQISANHPNSTWPKLPISQVWE